MDDSIKKPFGNFSKNGNGHVTFVPLPLPPKILYDEQLITILNEAHYYLGMLSGICRLVTNLSSLIDLNLKIESVSSSNLGEIQLNIIDISNIEAECKIEKKYKNPQIIEVKNYVKSLKKILEDVSKGIKVDKKILKTLHTMLLNDVKGREKIVGEFRTVQTWIGMNEVEIENALYVPPPPEKVDILIQNLIDFINNPPGIIPPLIQCAMIHYMFEAIHPFEEGNGRIGRLIIYFFLLERKLVDCPILHFSTYLERNKEKYYSLLSNVSQNSEWNEWIKFFLFCMIEQSKDSIRLFQQMTDLRRKYKIILYEEKASKNSTVLVDHLFSNPIITVSNAKDYLNITYRGAKRIVDFLIKNGILQEYINNSRGKKFVAGEILSIVIQTFVNQRPI